LFKNTALPFRVFTEQIQLRPVNSHTIKSEQLNYNRSLSDHTWITVSHHSDLAIKPWQLMQLIQRLWTVP